MASQTDLAFPPVPAHVPEHLIWDESVDAFPMQFADPYVEACDAMHALPDIVWATKGAHTGRPGWVLSRFAHLEEVYVDAKRFSAAHSDGAARFLGIDLKLLPTESDPPDHKLYRQVLQPFFQPSAVKTIEKMVRQTCDDLIDKFADKGGCEFVEDFSGLFPSYVFLTLMGMPHEMLPKFMEWEHAFVRGETWEEQVSGTRAVYEYITEVYNERKRNPGDDLVSKIAASQVDGRPIADKEAIGMCMTLYFGGLDTVMNSSGWCMRHLAKDQALQKRLRENPDLIPAAIDELTRAYGVTSTFRTVMEDLEFHGVKMLKGDIVALPTFFAGRDPQKYDNPHEVDIERGGRSLTFGSGVHNCLGIHLAKRELRVVVQSFLERFQNIRIPEGAKEEWTTVMIWGLEKLPLTWDR